ncbi:YcxB family protein [Flavobacterium psychroterrae]|uniref:YcxB family protein n=1 Tax=Flavobacterium psychroterrae TaxID=2133767 RepID=A0ABS5PIB0_9FLAO|nr:YcxB family protein [Flavobacterium psychroterrae]MBS7234039.1 YcxB family protein [Flavobacterium psychroterrae]
MIQTKKYQLTQKEYFLFLIRILLKKRWWLFAFILLISISILFRQNKDGSDTFIMVFGFIYPLIIIFQFWRFAYSKENEIIFKERKHEIFPDKIISRMGEISESTIPIKNFIKVFELKDLYILYISKGQTFFLPKRIFETLEDENWFRNEVFLKIKNK